MARAPRFGFDDTDPKIFRLVSDDFDLYEPIFNDSELDGGGYDWEAVAQYLAIETLDGADEIEFDSEASMFCAISKNRLALKGLEQVMRTTFRNKKKLASAIQAATEEAAGDPEDRAFENIVVLQFECYFDEYDLLLDSLDVAHDGDYSLFGSVGGGESTIWFRTDHVEQTIAFCKMKLKKLNLLETVIIGSRKSDDSKYLVRWPKHYKKKLEPINEWILDA